MLIDYYARQRLRGRNAFNCNAAQSARSADSILH